MNFTPTRQQSQSVFPHRTEDTAVEQTTLRCENGGPINWFAPDTSFTYGSVSIAFSGLVVHSGGWNGVSNGVYVPAGAQ